MLEYRKKVRLKASGFLGRFRTIQLYVGRTRRIPWYELVRMHEAPSLLQPRPRDWWLRIVLIPKSLNFIETLFAVSESLKFIERYLCLCKQSVFHTIVNHALRVEIPCILAHSNMITACMHRGMHPAFVIRRSAGLRAWTGRSRRIDLSVGV